MVVNSGKPLIPYRDTMETQKNGRHSSRKVNSSGKAAYVTNLLVLDPENSSGTNYAVEVWNDEPHDRTACTKP